METSSHESSAIKSECLRDNCKDQVVTYTSQTFMSDAAANNVMWSDNIDQI